MNIKKVYISVLCIALSLCISISVFAEVNLDDFAYFADDGSLQYDMDSYYYAYAKDLVAHSGVDIDPFVYWVHDPVSGDYIGYNYDSFKADYDSAISALASVDVDVSVSDSYADDITSSEFDDNIDDEIIDDDVEIALLETPLETDTSTTEPDVPNEEVITKEHIFKDLRSRTSHSTVLTFTLNKDEPLAVIDNRFGSQLYISDIQLTYDELMRGSFIAFQDDILLEGFPLSDIVDNSTELPDGLFGSELFVFCYKEQVDNLYSEFYPYIGLYVPSVILDELDSTKLTFMFYFPDDINISDSRIMKSLKNLVISVFGQYEPVTSTAVFTDTSDYYTTTTLVDVVASGMAGVDWEWCAGVFLFGIMLFCLFKLLGGILS